MGMRKLLPFITRTLARLSEGRVNFDYVLPDFATPWKICLMSCTKLIVAMKSRARRSRNLPVLPPPHPSGKSHRPQYQREVGEVKRRKWSHLQGAKGVSASANVSVNVSTRSCLCKVKEEAPASREGGGWGKGEQGLGY